MPYLRYLITGERAALAAAYDELQRQAELFADANLRTTFIKDVGVDQTILNAWNEIRN